MPSYTTSLRLIQPATGEYSGSWGTQVNNGITALVDTSIAGTASITMTAADYTLSTANGATDEARAMFLVLGGTPGAARNVICPAVSKLYFVTNNTTGGFAQTVKTASGSGISVPNGARMTLRCDGTDVVVAQNYFASLTLGSALPVASGGTGATTSTGSGAVVLATSPALAGTPTAPTASPGTNTTQIATTAFVQGALNISALYPVGSIYMNATNATNPATLLGFGTWVAFGAGRVPVGFDAGNALFDTAEETGGSADAIAVAHTHTFSATTGTESASHTHSGTTDSAGSHDHNTNAQTAGSGSFAEGLASPSSPGGTVRTDSAGAHTHTFSTGGVSANHTHSVSGTTASTGSSGTNANYQPYITVYMWKRTA